MGKAEDPEVDLDFDLFNFAEVMPDEPAAGEEDVNLDEIFSAFEEEEVAEGTASAPPEEDDGELGDDLFGDAFRRAGVEEVLPAPSAAPGAAPARKEASEDKALEPAAAEAAAARRSQKERADAPQDEPAPAVTGPARRRRRLLTNSAIAIVLALTLLNVSVALVTFRSASVMPAKLESVSREMTAAALRMREQPAEAPHAAPVEHTPAAALASDAAVAPEDNATLKRAALDIEAGASAEARRRVYALLSVADRNPEAARADLEARSLFLLARSYRAEALHAGDPR